MTIVSEETLKEVEAAEVVVAIKDEAVATKVGMDVAVAIKETEPEASHGPRKSPPGGTKAMSLLGCLRPNGNKCGTCAMGGKLVRPEQRVTVARHNITCHPLQDTTRSNRRTLLQRHPL
jgi:hypothetical protein